MGSLLFIRVDDAEQQCPIKLFRLQGGGSLCQWYIEQGAAVPSVHDLFHLWWGIVGTPLGEIRVQQRVAAQVGPNALPGKLIVPLKARDKKFYTLTDSQISQLARTGNLDNDWFSHCTNQLNWSSWLQTPDLLIRMGMKGDLQKLLPHLSYKSDWEILRIYLDTGGVLTFSKD